MNEAFSQKRYISADQAQSGSIDVERWGHFGDALQRKIELQQRSQKYKERELISDLEKFASQEHTFNSEVSRWYLELVQNRSPEMATAMDNLGLDLTFFHRLATSKHYVDICLSLLVINQAAKVFSFDDEGFDSQLQEALTSYNATQNHMSAEAECAIVSECLYGLKNKCLQAALVYADSQAPAHSWGYHKKEGSFAVIYFDLPGVGQVSFHMPAFSSSTPVAERDSEHTPIYVPRYHGEWNLQNDDEKKYLNFRRAWERYKTGRQPLSYAITCDLLRAYDFSKRAGIMPPQESAIHDIFLRFSGHVDFHHAQKRQVIEEWIASLISTLPQTVAPHYVKTGRLANKLPDQIKNEPWRRDVEPTLNGLLQYINELEVLKANGFSRDEISARVESSLLPALRFYFANNYNESRTIIISRCRDLSLSLNLNMKTQQHLADFLSQPNPS